MSAVEIVDAYLAGLDGAARRLAHAEWGLSLDAAAAGGHPLDVGIRVADELLRAQAFAAPGRAELDSWLLMHWNRQTRLIRFGAARSGDVWVHGDVPVAGLDARAVDRLLGLLVQGATRVREYAAAMAQEAAGTAEPAPSWLSGAVRPPADD